MVKKKIYNLLVSRSFFSNRPTQKTVWKGTVDELTKSFSYTLLCGHSWNSRVNTNPKTFKSLVSNLNKAEDAKSRYAQMTSYVGLTDEEVAKLTTNNNILFNDIHEAV